ncbi:lytic transglycosylase domain-containing protein [uncultured Jatrophihabitans sp.]|uniref:lytic transglycosylase domain-containing protein n=1 Tax=uncultured Jatrophihabitans sp. TaxID=1610747 RepID=UPI0035CC7DCB
MSSAAHRCPPRRVQRHASRFAAAGCVLAAAGLTAALTGASTANHADAGPQPHRAAVARAAAPTVMPAADSATTPASVATPARPSVTARPVSTPARLERADVTTVSGLASDGIPSVALNAYRVAAARVGHADPGCGIDWALLAGIGREESDHGRFAGAVLHADGRSTPAVVGPALDGVHWDYFKADAEYVRVTGDATFAHALGPMQFIPSTWATWGADADGDHRADVFDINDAALGAARYLCAAGGNLRTHAGQVAAVLAYNHSDTYLAQVLALADAYRHGVPVTGIPSGNTTGPLSTPRHRGKLPPVNPAPPTAAQKGSGTHKTGPTRPAAPSSPTGSLPTAPSSGTSTCPTRTSGRPTASGSSTAPTSPSRSASASASASASTSASRTTPTPSPTRTSTSSTRPSSPGTSTSASRAPTHTPSRTPGC